MKKLLFFCLTVLFCFFGCGKTNKSADISIKCQSEISLTDTYGNNVSMPDKAKRVVALFDPCVDIMYMLGAESLLVGVPTELYFDSEQYDYFCHIDNRVLNKEIPTPGSNELMNIESVIALKPDLVLTQHIPSSTVKILNNSGIAVYMATADSYDNIIHELNDIAVLTGTENRGRALSEFASAKINEINTRSGADEPDNRKSVYFTWANGRIFSTTGHKSMMHNCLLMAGVDNACPTDIDRPNINPETLIKWNPDIIVMWNDSPDLFYNKRELKRVKAVANGDIYNLMPMFFYNPHTLKSLCVAAAISDFAYGINNEQAEETQQEIKEIIKVLYGKEKAEKLLKYFDYDL